jgi:hypothetical protein
MWPETGGEWIIFNPSNITIHNLKHSLHSKLTFKDCSGLIYPTLFSLYISSVHNFFLKLMGVWHVAKYMFHEMGILDLSFNKKSASALIGLSS